MGRILYLSDEEVSQLQAGVLGDSAPTMDFELEAEYVEGWEGGRNAVNQWIKERLEEVWTIPSDSLKTQATRLAIDLEKVLTNSDLNTSQRGRKAIDLHVQMDNLYEEIEASTAADAKEAGVILGEAIDRLLKEIFNLDPKKSGRNLYEPKHRKVGT